MSLKKRKWIALIGGVNESHTDQGSHGIGDSSPVYAKEISSGYIGRAFETKKQAEQYALSWTGHQVIVAEIVSVATVPASTLRAY